MRHIYFICGFKNSALFELAFSGQLSPANDCNEILIESTPYYELEACERDFVKTMQQLCKHEINFSGGMPYTLVVKSHDPSSSFGSDLASSTGSSILYTFFVADISAAQESSIRYNIFGCVKTIAE